MKNIISGLILTVFLSENVGASHKETLNDFNDGIQAQFLKSCPRSVEKWMELKTTQGKEEIFKKCVRTLKDRPKYWYTLLNNNCATSFIEAFEDDINEESNIEAILNIMGSSYLRHNSGKTQQHVEKYLTEDNKFVGVKKLLNVN